VLGRRAEQREWDWEAEQRGNTQKGILKNKEER
jgi:hypothetical protein